MPFSSSSGKKSSVDAAIADELLGYAQQKQAILKEEKRLRELLAKTSKRLGPEHSDTLECMSELAHLIFSLGKMRETEKILRDLHEIFLRVYGPEHEKTLANSDFLASLLLQKGDLAGAEPMYRHVMEISERVLGPEHPNSLRAVLGVAILLTKQGKFEEAEPLFARLLELGRKVFPKNSEPLYLIEKAYRSFRDCVSQSQKN